MHAQIQDLHEQLEYYQQLQENLVLNASGIPGLLELIEELQHLEYQINP